MNTEYKMVPVELLERIIHSGRFAFEQDADQSLQDIETDVCALLAAAVPPQGEGVFIHRYAESSGGVYAKKDGGLCDYHHIERLNSEIDSVRQVLESTRDARDAAQYRVSELTQGDAQPVAWIKSDVASTLTAKECCYAFGSQNPKGSLIPLYTRPDAGEVEAQRLDLRRSLAREEILNMEIDTLRAQLAERDARILWMHRELHALVPDGYTNHDASAEPGVKP